MPLDIDIQDDMTCAHLSGEFSISTVESLQDDLKGLLNHHQVQVDVSGVTEIDSCGCQMLALLARAAQERQRELKVKPGNALVDDALRLLGLAPQLLAGG